MMPMNVPSMAPMQNGPHAKWHAQNVLEPRHGHCEGLRCCRPADETWHDAPRLPKKLPPDAVAQQHGPNGVGRRAHVSLYQRGPRTSAGELAEDGEAYE